jgi:hypothetical protein
LDSLIAEIAEHLTTLPEGQFGKNAQIILQVHMTTNRRVGLDQHILALRQLVCVDGRSNPNLNARIGIILGRRVSSQNISETLRKMPSIWRPISAEYPSSLETIAVAHQVTVGSPSSRSLNTSSQVLDDRFDDSNQNRTQDDTTFTTFTLEATRKPRQLQLPELLASNTLPTNADPLVKTLVGFVYAQRSFFSLAKRTLRESMREIEQHYGPLSWEMGVVVAECAKCCNMLQQYRMAEQMIRSALRRRAGLENRPDSQYLQIILADTLLAKANYVDAAELLERVFSSELSASSPVVMKATLRKAKIHRRLGEVFPSQKVTSNITHGLQALGQVNDGLRSAFMDEINRNIVRIDSRNTPMYQEAQELADVLEEIQSCKDVGSEIQRNQAKLLQTYIGRIEQLYAFSLPQNTDSLPIHHIIEPELRGPVIEELSTQLHTRSLDSQRLWDAYTAFNVTGRYARGMNCYGTNRHGRRCNWDISRHKYEELRRILDYIETQPPRDAEEYLRDIARVCLCQDFHQGQAGGLVTTWESMLKDIPYAGDNDMTKPPTQNNIRQTNTLAPPSKLKYSTQSLRRLSMSLGLDKYEPPKQEYIRTANLSLRLGGGIVYKRYGESVMGLWAKATHRKIVYDQLPFRIEVIFETPVFFVAPPDNRRGPIAAREIYYIDGTPHSYKHTRTLSPHEEEQQRSVYRQRVHTADDERATWLTLLSTLQSRESSSREWDQRKWSESPTSADVSSVMSRIISNQTVFTLPTYSLAAAIQSKTQSWDMIPPQITKPYATTALCHLVEMMAMLGLFWKTFDPATWSLRAEGNGLSLNSTNVQGLGVMVFFTVTGKSMFKEKCVIPCQELKELSFGTIPTIYEDREDLGIIAKTLKFGSVDDTTKTLYSLGLSSASITKYHQHHEYLFLCKY